MHDVVVGIVIIMSFYTHAQCIPREIYMTVSCRLGS